MSKPTEFAPCRRTIAADLLKDALASVDAAMIAQVVGVPQAKVLKWSEGKSAMNFTERMATVMALITLAPMGSDLFRRPARLRVQLAASIEYEHGVTTTATQPPRQRF